MLTRKAKYALRALMCLAEGEQGKPVLIADLAAIGRIPKKFLERILLDLNRAGFLRSRKGKGGGYFLGRRPEQISVGGVIRLMDGPLAPVSCVSETAYAPCSECPDQTTCGIRSVMKEARDAIARILDGTTLAQMVQRSRAAEKTRSGMPEYEI
jgi:Rrf2 family protein